MSNLQTAKDALLAELVHAREGLAFYQDRVQSLEQAYASLSSLDSKGESVNMSAPRGRRAKKAAPTDGKPAATRRSSKTQASLPATGKDFWSGLISSEPKSSREILDHAVKSLGITPSKDDLKKLAQRQANALHMLVKAKTISDTGTGRERRYLRS